MTRARTAHGDGGFTLIEVVTAMLLVTVGLLGILGVYDGSRG